MPYADLPGHRFALDKDGSIAFRIMNDNSLVVLNSTETAEMNDEDDSAYISGNSPVWVGWVFPQTRTILGVFQGGYDNDSGGNDEQWLYSTDTTNGQDGTWTELLPTLGATQSAPTLGRWRSAIRTCNQAGVKGVKTVRGSTYSFQGTNISTVHVYGTIDGGPTDRLALWHPTLDQQLAANDFNWGDIGQGSTADKTFRVKNLSATLTASSITVSLDALTHTTMATQHSLSDDGSTFGTTISITTLAPGVMSSVLTLRRSTPSNAAIGPHAMRVLATAASWA